MKRTVLLKLLGIFMPLLILSCNPVSKLGKDPEVLKWQQEVSTLKAMPVSYAPATLLFVGSSSIRLWDSIQKDMFPYPAINRGYGGAKLKDFTFYANELTAPHKAAAIVLFIANDITGDVNDLTPENVLNYFKLAVKEIRKNHPGIPIVWIEVTPTPARWSVWPEISRSNELINSYCNAREDLFFIPTSTHFMTDNGKPDPCLFLPDMLHLNRRGYKVWSKVIKHSLDSGLPELKKMQQ
ncbi:MAG: hypothetical protein KUL83_00010 [Lentimicrobium sp.]|mgnify:CR=1 FL=1|jgi:lysophospholipase L1-like esterase|nr:hypothetical protein [Lentimicrobium sp.]MDD2527883.1 GDSL-type esterase/lipase family protein [Lentimicrobiaceae bacterium]MDD4597918.1 GDSL-type esterase/lipase family protein [Lentimicrobiaceae bacterium]MDY0024396.1 GDSL-type esterase/lipase family protein [Lentimicrobium sp.]